MPVFREEGTFADFLDPEIKKEVLTLRASGVETFQSCQGGEGHADPDPTVRLHGGRSEGIRALSIAMSNGLKVYTLSRTWRIEDGEIVGPWWELTFVNAR